MPSHLPNPEEKLRQAVSSGRAVIVAGTGVSMSASWDPSTNKPHPQASWAGLLEDGLAWLREHDLMEEDKIAAHRVFLKGDTDIHHFVAAAEDVTRSMGGAKSEQFAKWLARTVGTVKAHDRKLLDALEALRAKGNLLATTNYDGLLLEIAGALEPVTWKEPAAFLSAARNRETDKVIFLHGYWRQPATVILDWNSYQEIARDENYRLDLATVWQMTTWLYVGCGVNGLSDPDFGLLLERYGKRAREAELWDFCLVPSKQREQFQAHFNKLKVNICAVSYGDSYDNLPEYLRSLLPDDAATKPAVDAVHLPPVETNFALPNWKQLYRKELKCCVAYSHNGSRHLLPQVLILDNTRRKAPPKEFSVRLQEPGFTLPSHVRAMTDNAFKLVCKAVGRWTDDENLRLYNLRSQELIVQSVRYEAYLRTNLSLDYRRQKGLESLRECLHGNGKLEPLPDSPLANNLGINILLFTSDGLLVLQKRSSTVAFRRGELCSAASGTLSIGDVKLPITLNHVNLLREGREELGLRTSDYIEERLQLLGMTRELIRGGEPEMFLFAESDLDRSELLSRRKLARDSAEAEKLIFYPFDRNVISGPLTGGRRAQFQDQFDKFVDNYGGKASIPLLTNLALWQQWKLTEI